PEPRRARDAPAGSRPEDPELRGPGRRGDPPRGRLDEDEPMSQTTQAPAKAESMPPKADARRWVYFFGDGHAEGNARMRDLLGGKGAGIAEMVNAGIPVPPGYTITT